MADTHFAPLKRVPLLEEELPAANPTVRLIKGARIKFAPGQPTGLHRHPISTVGVVTAGSFHLQLEGKPVQLLKTGDSFFEPAGHTILKFDNASPNEPAEIVCFYLADTNELRQSKCSRAAWTVSLEKNSGRPGLAASTGNGCTPGEPLSLALG